MGNPLLNISKPVSKQTFSEVRHSAGIADDFAVRKVISTKEGTIEKVPVNDNDIVNKAYADSIAGGLALPLKQLGDKLFINFAADTYLIYNSVTHQLEFWVDGVLVNSFG